jgi:hypothetical protein
VIRNFAHLFSECFLEGYQGDPDENYHHSAELDNSVSRKREGQVVWCFNQAKRDSNQAWEDYWLKQGMSRELVSFWR